MSMSGCRSSPVTREGERYCERSTWKAYDYNDDDDFYKLLIYENIIHTNADLSIIRQLSNGLLELCI